MANIPSKPKAGAPQTPQPEPSFWEGLKQPGQGPVRAAIFLCLLGIVGAGAAFKIWEVAKRPTTADVTPKKENELPKMEPWVPKLDADSERFYRQVADYGDGIFDEATKNPICEARAIKALKEHPAFKGGLVVFKIADTTIAMREQCALILAQANQLAIAETGASIGVVSGYRSFKSQEKAYENSLNKWGKKLFKIERKAKNLPKNCSTIQDSNRAKQFLKRRACNIEKGKVWAARTLLKGKFKQYFQQSAAARPDASFHLSGCAVDLASEYGKLPADQLGWREAKEFIKRVNPDFICGHENGIVSHFDPQHCDIGRTEKPLSEEEAKKRDEAYCADAKYGYRCNDQKEWKKRHDEWQKAGRPPIQAPAPKAEPNGNNGQKETRYFRKPQLKQDRWVQVTRRRVA